MRAHDIKANITIRPNEFNKIHLLEGEQIYGEVRQQKGNSQRFQVLLKGFVFNALWKNGEPQQGKFLFEVEKFDIKTLQLRIITDHKDQQKAILRNHSQQIWSKINSVWIGDNSLENKSSFEIQRLLGEILDRLHMNQEQSKFDSLIPLFLFKGLFTERERIKLQKKWLRWKKWLDSGVRSIKENRIVYIDLHEMLQHLNQNRRNHQKSIFDLFLGKKARGNESANIKELAQNYKERYQPFFINSHDKDQQIRKTPEFWIGYWAHVWHMHWPKFGEESLDILFSISNMDQSDIQMGNKQIIEGKGDKIIFIFSDDQDFSQFAPIITQWLQNHHKWRNNFQIIHQKLVMRKIFDYFQTHSMAEYYS